MAVNEGAVIDFIGGALAAAAAYPGGYPSASIYDVARLGIGKRPKQDLPEPARGLHQGHGGGDPSSITIRPGDTSTPDPDDTWLAGGGSIEMSSP